MGRQGCQYKKKSVCVRREEDNRYDVPLVRRVVMPDQRVLHDLLCQPVLLGNSAWSLLYTGVKLARLQKLLTHCVALLLVGKMLKTDDVAEVIADPQIWRYAF